MPSRLHAGIHKRGHRDLDPNLKRPDDRGCLPRLPCASKIFAAAATKPKLTAMTLPPDEAAAPPLGAIMATGGGLVLALAGVLASPEGAPLEELAARVWVPLPDWLTIAAVAALSAASLIYLAMAKPWRRPRQRENEFERDTEAGPTSRIVGILLILLALTPGAMLAAAILWIAQFDLYGGGRLSVDAFRGSPLEASSAADLPARPASPVTTGLIGALALLVGFGSLGLALWLAFGDRLYRPVGGFALPRHPFATAVEDSLDDLRREADARVAIIRIYGNFERAVATADLPRRPWQTPVEFMRAVLGSLPVPAAPIANLTHLFEIARFSRHALGAHERESAWQSLSEIRAALDDERRETPDVPPG